ncbi:homing endonuclease associated repeat-containing protein [Natrinema thermotolerans]|uniref:homing endonuclease associated repeat-containing protein n=1 Tax=Natrinema thermotolerans TaxID=121872 RepID=UPI00067901EA|nr:hypothetical protein [Natrinema thermotolerans]QCC57291.1 hypothetical protein DVR14_01035 [Natrinema thermotolerans]
MPTDQDYLADLRAFAAEIGETPTRKRMNDDGPHSSTPYYNRWGSWNDALAAAGLDPNHEYVSDDDLLAELQRLADEYGQPVLVEDMDDHGEYDPATYFRRFESWFDAREQAGLNPEDVRPGRRVDEDDLLAAVRDLATDLGRPPSQSEMNARGDRSLTPYLRRWGTWDQALEAAGLGTRE